MGAGHASTSIGYAVGLKEGDAPAGDGDDGKVVAVIGDGAMTGGVAFEAIAPGRRPRHADRRRAQRQRHVDRAERRRALALLQPRPPEPEAVARARGRRGAGSRSCPAGIGAAFERLGPQLKESIKAFWAPGLFWEELDWAYMGVIDGHDVARAARRAARGARRRAPGRRAHRDRQGQGLRAGRGRRPRGHGEVARRQAEVDRSTARRRAAAKPRRRRARAAAAVHDRSSARRSCASASATRASSASPPR